MEKTTSDSFAALAWNQTSNQIHRTHKTQHTLDFSHQTAIVGSLNNSLNNNCVGLTLFFSIISPHLMRHLPFVPDPTAPRSVLCTLMNDLFQNIPDQTSLHFTMQVPPVAPNNYSIPHQQQSASTIPTSAAGDSYGVAELTNNGNTSTLTETAQPPLLNSVAAWL